MTAAADKTRRIRAQDLQHRPVRAKNGRVIGRIEELRVESRDDRYEVVEYVMGVGGLLERLAIVGRRLFGAHPQALIARWDQIDLTQPDRPKLTCDRADLRVE